MVRKDFISQWLMGDELKQDQFKFFYDTVKIVYYSALRDLLLQGNEKVLDDVIPQLIAYKAIMNIKRINEMKMDEAKKAKEKQEREGSPLKKIEESKTGLLTE